MSDDLYAVLGVKKEASQDDIRTAYRKLAKELHPDVNPGDAAAEERFKAVAGANDILGDEDKRAQYDRGEIDASGQENQRSYYRHYADAEAENPYQSSAGFEDLGDIFSDLFGRGGGQGGGGAHNIRMRGADVRYTMTVEFLEAINGAKKRVTMPDGKVLDVGIPAGTRDGQMLRLKGQGGTGMGGGPAGNAFVQIETNPHAYFRRDGSTIRVELPVSLTEAVLGGKVQVPTRTGAVTMTIPANSNTGTVLRLKGKGVPKSDGSPDGDQMVELKVMLPTESDPDLEALIREWSETHAYDPRAGMEA